jgi:hypothetical protein
MLRHRANQDNDLTRAMRHMELDDGGDVEYCDRCNAATLEQNK